MMIFSFLSEILFANFVSAAESDLVFNIKGKNYVPKLLEKKEVELKVWELDLPKTKGITEKVYIYQVGENNFFTRLYHYDPKSKFLVLDSAKSAQLIINAEALKKIKEAENLLAKEGLIPKLSKDKKVIYVFLDPLCPFCKKEVEKGLLDELQKKYNVVLIPFAIHKKRSEDVIANMMYHAKGGKTDLVAVFKEAFSDNSKFKVLASINFAEDKYHNLAKKITQLLEEAGIFATPSYIIDNKVYIGKFPAKYLESKDEK